MYFSLIRLIPDFYDMYIMYSQQQQILFIIIIFYNPKFKKLSSSYDC